MKVYKSNEERLIEYLEEYRESVDIKNKKRRILEVLEYIRELSKDDNYSDKE